MLRNHITMAIAALTLTCNYASANSTLETGQQLSGHIKTVPGGGHFILAHGDRAYDIILADFRAPKRGEPGDNQFIEAMNRMIYPPIFCEVDRVASEGIYAFCFLEDRAPLGDLLRKWGVPEASSD